MAILKNDLKEKFSKIPNYIIETNEEELSSGAYRLLTYLYAKPTNWNINQNNIANHYGVSLKTITNRINELKDKGYITIDRTHVNGRFDYTYTLEYNKQNLTCSTMRNKTTSRKTTSSNTIHSKSTQHNKTNNNKTEYSNTDNSNTKTIDTYFSSSELNVLFEEFLAMRKELKAKNTDRAIKLLVSELNKFDDVAKKKMIEQSIMNSWKSVYPLKNNKQPDHEDKMEWLRES